MSKKKTAPKTRPRPTPFRFPIEITDGHHGSRVSRRELSYPQPPHRWTAVDLVNITRTMAQTAADVRRVKIADHELTVFFELRDGGTEMTVSHTVGAWAHLRGRSMIQISPIAIAGLVAASTRCYNTHMQLPALLPSDAEAVRQKQADALRWLERVERNIRGEMKRMGAR